ncbi:hypothetical protein D6764_04015, partial [Candidatus Woesearchaeota archaeon]
AYAGVILTLGFELSAVLTGAKAFRTLFGLGRSSNAIRTFARFCFSSGTNSVSLLLDKGVLGMAKRRK